ncbi:MAG: SulP family inorganic anion transporter, partial [Rhizobacter sp.]|nr:SulP family inorganic anion transporter [Chlorobiales bacterium]
VVVLLGIGFNFLYRAAAPDWALGSTDTVSHLVSLPVPKDLSGFLSQFTFPDFSSINGKVITVAITLALVASIESLLSLEAVDKLDPFKRASPTNQELIAQGVGNIASGLIGGLPVTAVIVRSSANVNAGARTKVSSLLHGVFLLASVIAIPTLLNQIPLASLAAVLLFTGYKLAKISLFKKMYAAGLDQFIPFVVTVVAILFTDLLKGIAVGMAVGVAYVLRDHYLTSFAYERERLLSGERIKIKLAEHVSFLNKAQIHDALMRVPANSTVVIDGSESAYIDYDTLEVINDFKENAAYRHIQLELIGIAEVYKTDTHH